MNYYEIFFTCLILGSIGLLIGIILSIAEKFFKVYVDEKEVKILKLLPGNNCGLCGYASCKDLANKIVKNKADANSCKSLHDKEKIKKISEIIGNDVNTFNINKRKVANIKCSGDCDQTYNKYHYKGPKTCSMLDDLPGKGYKSCSYGCLGIGDCVKVCNNGAISIVKGVAVVDKEKCVGCEKCLKVCPKNLIEMIPYESKVYIGCNSKDKGNILTKVCKVGCLGCGLCKKSCDNNCIDIKNNLAIINYDKCNNCLKCFNECRRNVIKKL